MIIHKTWIVSQIHFIQTIFFIYFNLFVLTRICVEYCRNVFFFFLPSFVLPTMTFFFSYNNLIVLAFLYEPNVNNF